MPGSPGISTTRPSPALARAQPRNTRSIPPSRPARRHRTGDPLDLDSGEITVLEEIADQVARARGDHDCARLGQGLQPSGEVRRFADDRLLLRRSFADQIADDHQPGGDPDARSELD